MKILVCVDGSKHSEKAIEKASLIADSNHVTEVTLIHIDEGKLDRSSFAKTGEGRSFTVMDGGNLKKLQQEDREERKNILQKAAKVFENKNIKVRKILKKGHPSQSIISIASKEGFDMIVIGSRGHGGLKKMLLGSVSNAVVQEVKNSSVLVVK